MVFKKILALLFGLPIKDYIAFESNDDKAYLRQFASQSNLCGKFVSFLVYLVYREMPVQDLLDDKYPLWNIFDMAERYL